MDESLPHPRLAGIPWGIRVLHQPGGPDFHAPVRWERGDVLPLLRSSPKAAADSTGLVKK